MGYLANIYHDAKRTVAVPSDAFLPVQTDNAPVWQGAVAEQSPSELQAEVYSPRREGNESVPAEQKHMTRQQSGRVETGVQQTLTDAPDLQVYDSEEKGVVSPAIKLPIEPPSMRGAGVESSGLLERAQSVAAEYAPPRQEGHQVLYPGETSTRSELQEVDARASLSSVQNLAQQQGAQPLEKQMAASPTVKREARLEDRTAVPVSDTPSITPSPHAIPVDALAERQAVLEAEPGVSAPPVLPARHVESETASYDARITHTFTETRADRNWSNAPKAAVRTTEPRVHIGHIDVVVLAPEPARQVTAPANTAGDLANRMYLRRL